MRDKRAIIIKSPRLQKIRNNLRLLWLKAKSSQWNKIFDEMDELRYNSDGTRRTIDDLSPSELESYRNLQEEQNRLKSLADKSICKCVACGKADRDMVYNKAYKAWYCTECYGMERVAAQKRAKARQKGSKSKPKSCEERDLEEHSKTFL